MTISIICAVTLGIITGSLIGPVNLNLNIPKISYLSLAFLVFCVGLGLGKNREIVQDIKELGLKTIALPFCVALGSISGAVLFGRIIKLPFNEASAIGAGFGWYSFSGIIIAQIYSVELGALAFLTNVTREVLTLIIIPILAKFNNPFLTIAPGGATTMDTTLPLINKCAGKKTAILGLINGFILSLLVLILVPLLISIGK